MAGSSSSNSAATDGDTVRRSLTPGTNRRPEQYGQPYSDRVLLNTIAFHWCPCLQSQERFSLDPAVIDVGSHPSAWEAISGWVVARSLTPTTTIRFAQIGHPTPSPDLLPIRAFQVWPDSHLHLAITPLPALTVIGSQPSACSARAGWVDARSLKPDTTLLFEHVGHDVPRTLWLIRAFQVCPSSHDHPTALELPADTNVGSQSSACAATSGWVVARSLKPERTFHPEQTAQPRVRTRSATTPSNSCPAEHRQRSLCLDPARIIVGSNPSASAATPGFTVARSLKPTSRTFPAQMPQPVPLLRLFGVALQMWPRSQRHSTFLLLWALSITGSQP